MPFQPNTAGTISRLRELAGVIKESADFDMCDWLASHRSKHTCNSSGCVAGHAAWYFGSEETRRRLLNTPHHAESFAAELLGLKYHEQKWLFYGHFARDADGDPFTTNEHRLRAIDQHHAARACLALADEMEKNPDREPPGDVLGGEVYNWMAVA